VQSNEEDATGEASEDHQPKRRRTSKELIVQRRRKPPAVPRIYTLDIRKCYAKMFVNVLNSGDFPLLYGFLDTYYVGTAHHVTTKYVKGHAEKCFTMNFCGIEEVAKYWYCMVSLSPDTILKLTESTIQHTTGKVICKIRKEGTHIYADPEGFTSYYAPYVFVEEKYTKENLYIGDYNTRDIKVGRCKELEPEFYHNQEEQTILEKTATIRSILKSVENVVGKLPLRSLPQTVGADCSLIIHTDENKRITKLELDIVY